MRFISWNTAPFDLKKPPVPAVYVRREFAVRPGLVRAELRMTALGCYIPMVNGVRPEGTLLAPGYTEYPKRLQVQSYDVTALLKEGTNALGAIVGDGWYRGSCGPMSARATYGDKTALAAVLELVYQSETETVETGTDWQWSENGPIRAQDIKLIEEYDARMELQGWSEAGYGADCWQNCIPAEYPGELIGHQGVQVSTHEVFRPVLLKTSDGSTVLDFGQNIAGFVRFKVNGKAGERVRLLHGEALDESGNFTTANLGDSKVMRLGQELVYTLKDGEQSYEPLFQINGFRYVKVTEWPGEVCPGSFEAVAVYSDCPVTGTFECDNEKINRLVKNLQWSQKSNFLEIPTDCPQRERAGWTGDINVFIECADLLVDTRDFISKWLRDVMLTQTVDGSILSIVPSVYMLNRKSREASPGAAGWADAIVHVPMQQYLSYGDPAALEECYGAMCRWVDYNTVRASKTGKLKYAFSRDRSYILDSGFHYGEWLEPGSANLADALKAVIAPDTEVATAWFFYSAKTLAGIAGILGKTEDLEKYSALAENIRRAYTENFLPPKGKDAKRQCKYVRPLYMGIAEGEEKQKLASQLNKLVTENGYRIGTGFLTTYQVLNVLTDSGYHETACRLLENESCPGWLYEVNCGATTIWEGWDAVDPATGKVKAKSLNHYSPGAALSWLWTRCAGIRPLVPGYSEIEIRPHVGGSMNTLRAGYESVAGYIESSWKRSNGRFELSAVIPKGVKARVVLPDGQVIENAATGIYSCII